MPSKKTRVRLPSVKRLNKLLRQVEQLEQNAAQDTHRYVVKRGDSLSPLLLQQAKKLHADIYLERSFIDPSDIGPDGFMHLLADPHQQHSDYFVLVDKEEPNKVLATARQIRTEGEHTRLPIINQAKLRVKSKNAILETDAQGIVEISGLAKGHGTPSAAVLELYLAMWADSMKKGHRTWLMACDVKLYRRLRILFGRAITRIGRRTHYKGGDIIPCKLELSESHIKFLKNLNSKHLVYGRVRRTMAEKFLNTYISLDKK